MKNDYIEIKAEIFKVARANSDKSASIILRAIKVHLPDVEIEVIEKALRELAG